MSNEPYTLLDAMREEIDTLKELQIVYQKQNATLNDAVVRTIRRSLERIVLRFENGHEYYMGINADGDPRLKYNVGTRHLEREYPAVAKAKNNLNTVVNLTKGKDDV